MRTAALELTDGKTFSFYPVCQCCKKDSILSDTGQFKCKLKCCKSCTFCARAITKERCKSRHCKTLQREIKICEKCFLCRSIVFCKTCNKCPTSATNLSVGARLQNFWQTWLDLGAGLKIVQILKEGYTLPFRTRPNLARHPTIISCYANPHWNLYLLETLHQLMDKNAVELVNNQKSLGFFQPAIFSAYTQQQVETKSRSDQSKPISQGPNIQDGDTRNH